MQVSGSLKLWLRVNRKYRILLDSKFSQEFNDKEKEHRIKESFSLINKKNRKHGNVVIELKLKSFQSTQVSRARTGFEGLAGLAGLAGLVGLVGLLDDGCSGVVNAFVQSLFQVPCFSQIVMAYEDCLGRKGVLAGLKALFCELQTSDEAVSPQELVRRLGLEKVGEVKGRAGRKMVVERIIRGIIDEGDEKVANCFVGKLQDVGELESSDVVFDGESFTNVYDCIQELLLKQKSSAGYKDLIEETKRKFLTLPDILIIALPEGHQFEYFPIINLPELSPLAHNETYFLISQISEIQTKSRSTSAACISLPSSCTLFLNEKVTPINPKLFSCFSSDPLSSKPSMCESGLSSTAIQNPFKAHFLIYSKQVPQRSPRSSILLKSKPNPVSQILAGVHLVGLEMVLGYEGPGFLSNPPLHTNSPTHPSQPFQLHIAKGLKGRDLRSELSRHIPDDYRLWTFTPGIKNWELRELKLNDQLAPDRSVFIEVILQKPIFVLKDLKWNFLHLFENSAKASLESDLADENLEMLTPSSAKAIVFYKWYDWNNGSPKLTLFKMVTLTSTSNMSQIRQDLISSWTGHNESHARLVLHLEKCKVTEYKNKENFLHVYSYRPGENYELTISKRGNFGVRHVIIDNGDAFIGENPPKDLDSGYMDAKKYMSTFFPN